MIAGKGRAAPSRATYFGLGRQAGTVLLGRRQLELWQID